MNRALKHFQSSELSRNSLKVFSAAEISPVLVTRRDGESLILMSEKEADAQSELFELAAQLIAVTIDNDGSLAERMAKHFPWMLALNAADRTQCADDLIRAGQAALSTGQAHHAVAVLTSWRETAIAIAAGWNDEELEWLDVPVLVERPA
jgi:PHD/YefM family antitoxin component YafN of YafNO toxin-antitoxin module